MEELAGECPAGSGAAFIRPGLLGRARRKPSFLKHHRGANKIGLKVETILTHRNGPSMLKLPPEWRLIS